MGEYTLRPAEEPVLSLVTTPASLLATCAACASNRVTTITMTLTDGSLVDFASCHACEAKSWKQAGTELDIATVLGKAKKHKAA
ncbi:MAG: hypothetical protein JWN35_631 [Frankiales bacterium]|jgi:hypothetical protein|nr:hypothetical protein [Frankiales bacterium]